MACPPRIEKPGYRPHRRHTTKPPDGGLVVEICALPIRENLERAKGLEPSTPTLARSCSTTELHPHPDGGDRSPSGAELCQMPLPNATVVRGPERADYRRSAANSPEIRPKRPRDGNPALGRQDIAQRFERFFRMNREGCRSAPRTGRQRRRWSQLHFPRKPPLRGLELWNPHTGPC